MNMAATPPTTRTSSIMTAAFQAAVQSFKAQSKLDHNQISELKATTLEDLEATILRTQETQRKSGKMMFLKRLDPFINAMKQYGEIINIFVNVNDFVAFIWGPVKFLLNILSNFSDAFNALLDGYYMIGKSIPLLLEYEQMVQNNPFLQKAMIPVYEHILEFHAEAVKYFNNKTWKTVFHATWNRLNIKIASLSHNLEQERTFFRDALELSKYKEDRAFQLECVRALDKLKDSINQQEKESQRRRQADQTQMRYRVQQWLEAVDSEGRLQQLLKIRHANSGDWLLSESQFQAWYDLNNCANPLLWLSGKPGAGKTVLSAFVIEQIKKLSSANIVYHFNQSTEVKTSGFLSIAKSLLSQMLIQGGIQNDVLLLALHEKMQSSASMTLKDTKLAKDMLGGALLAAKNMYVVIDGLDENSNADRKEITKWFQDLVNSLPTNRLGALRVLFVSQHDGSAKKDLSMLSHIEIMPTKNSQDIRSYVKAWHTRIEEKFGLVRIDGNDLVELVTIRADGMFLYAHLVCANLYEQTTRSDLQHELEPDILPNGITQAYERIINRVLSPDSSPTARQANIVKLLGWLTCAQRPLYWYEIQGAMSIDIDECSFDPERRFVEDCKDLCASLVESRSDGSVALVHSTTRDFLIQQDYVRERDVNIDMAILCLTYLNFPIFVSEITEADIQQSISNGVHAFLEYAVAYWGLHIEAGCSGIGHLSIDKQRMDLLSECLEAFLDSHWNNERELKNVSASATLRDSLEILSSHDMFEKALLSISTLKKSLRPLGKNAPLEEMLLIYKFQVKHRSIFEDEILTKPLAPRETNLLIDLYGPSPFKCSNFNCQYFHSGFDTRQARETHLERHNRPFLCTMEGCPQSLIGCISFKELEKHRKENHRDIIAPEEEQFPDELEEISTDLRIKMQRHPATFECSLCSKRFTRAHNLRNHLRTHTRERPFQCSKCEISFARQHDRNRHERLHSSEKKFICGGDLAAGGRWGCGKRVQRADQLGSHFRSKTGRACIKPLVEEEAERCQRLGLYDRHPEQSFTPEQETTVVNDPTWSLPENLLQQYPVLREFRMDDSPV